MLFDYLRTKPVKNCIVLTGIPRSGTTLVCRLLNATPNTVALVEPMDVTVFLQRRSARGKLRELRGFLRANRETLLRDGTAISKHFKGAPDNPWGPSKDGALREQFADLGEVKIDKQLDANFQLVVKHPAAFTAILDVLAPAYPCYALVRNPLSVLGSWNSAKLAVQRGRIPIAEKLDPALTQKLKGLDDAFDRQLAILDWFFACYCRALPVEAILRYEDVIASGGSLLKVITPAAAQLDERLSSRNTNKQYDQMLLGRLGRRLLSSQGAYWDLYERVDVEGILNASGPTQS